MASDALDPKGLIYEAYQIPGITEGECRSIFLDWAIGRPVAVDQKAEIGALLAQYAETAVDHPMTKVLREGLDAPKRTGRRGGWRARR